MKRKWWLVLLIAVLAAALAFCFVELLLPYMQARSAAAPNGVLTIREQADGNLAVSWQEVADADFYCVELYEPVEEKEEPVMLYQKWIYGATACVIPSQDPDTLLTLQVTPGKDYETLGKTHRRYSQSKLQVTTTFDAPTLSGVTYTPDTDNDTLNIQFDLKQGDTCVITRLEAGGATELQSITEGKTQITFGEGKDLPLPAWNESETFCFTAQRRGTGYEFYGQESGRITVVGEDFLDRQLNLTLEDLGNNLCRLTWNETKGEFFEVQTRADETQEWTTLKVVTREDGLAYASEKLEPFSHYEFRVAAVGGQTMKDSEFAAVSDVQTVDSQASPLYCTVWPTKALTAYADPQKTTELTKVETGKAYCVLEVAEGMFRVLTDKGEGYIDSNYCMINLPEFIGQLCAYDITNSYDSLYMVHEYEMPEITGEVITGYKNIRFKDGSYLVPLLYPVALKLVDAGLSARDHGYRLKIYDAYRPNKTTLSLYKQMTAMLDDPIPEETYTGKEVELKTPPVEEVTPETGPDGEQLPTEAPEEPVLTYRFVMTDNKWTTGSFLASSVSKHNQGIAVDLTLEKLENGKELEMQTSMHDLSWYSNHDENNDNAKMLKKIMKAAGFSTINSEWWHYQDNTVLKQLSPPVVKEGVNGACWMKDTNGWRYRQKNGEFITDCTETVDGVSYTFDANGYIQGNP